MNQPMAAIATARFKDPEEDTTATVTRLYLAACHHRVSLEGLRTLVALTALACGANGVVSMSVRAADLDELEIHKLIHQSAHDTVVLL